MTNKSIEEEAKSLFWNIMIEEMVWSEMCNIKNMTIDPMLAFCDDENPKYKGIHEKFSEIEKGFDELLDLIKNCQDKDVDAFYDLMRWEKPDKDKMDKFVNGIMGVVIATTLIESLKGDDE